MSCLLCSCMIRTWKVGTLGELFSWILPLSAFSTQNGSNAFILGWNAWNFDRLWWTLNAEGAWMCVKAAFGLGMFDFYFYIWWVWVASIFSVFVLFMCICLVKMFKICCKLQNTAWLRTTLGYIADTTFFFLGCCAMKYNITFKGFSFSKQVFLSWFGLVAFHMIYSLNHILG